MPGREYYGETTYGGTEYTSSPAPSTSATTSGGFRKQNFQDIFAAMVQAQLQSSPLSSQGQQTVVLNALLAWADTLLIVDSSTLINYVPDSNWDTFDFNAGFYK